MRTAKTSLKLWALLTAAAFLAAPATPLLACAMEAMEDCCCAPADPSDCCDDAANASQTPDCPSLQAAATLPAVLSAPTDFHAALAATGPAAERPRLTRARMAFYAARPHAPPKFSSPFLRAPPASPAFGA